MLQAAQGAKAESNPAKPACALQLHATFEVDSHGPRKQFLGRSSSVFTPEYNPQNNSCRFILLHTYLIHTK